MRLSSLSLSLLLAAGSANAGYLVDLDVESNGRQLEQWHHNSGDWVAGENGSAYDLVLRNKHHARVLVVVAVDGINAVSGKTAGYNQTGYVLEPGQVARIQGWRKSMQDIAQFRFTYPDQSYAAQTNRARNIGTIGIAVFKERVYAPPPPQPPIAYESQASRGAASAPMAKSLGGSMADSVSSLGTAHGEQRYSPTSKTEFERDSSRPAEVLQLRYDSEVQLMRAGVIPQVRHKHYMSPRPTPFPNEFVPDPGYTVR